VTPLVAEPPISLRLSQQVSRVASRSVPFVCRCSPEVPLWHERRSGPYPDRLDICSRRAIVLDTTSVIESKNYLKSMPEKPDQHARRNIDSALAAAGCLEDSASLPDPDVLAAEIVGDLQAALDEFALIAADLRVK